MTNFDKIRFDRVCLNRFRLLSLLIKTGQLDQFNKNRSDQQHYFGLFYLSGRYNFSDNWKFPIIIGFLYVFYHEVNNLTFLSYHNIIITIISDKLLK